MEVKKREIEFGDELGLCEVETKYLVLHVENSPTILYRILQVVKCRRINIQAFIAKESSEKNEGEVKLVIEANSDDLFSLIKKLEKLMDVITVKCS
ncbi:MAG: hypothetical protein JWQ30_2501 [Sediminibacterium sp.]|nr:hypothetical protein [Sediminibacterium sp.]